MRWWRAQVPVSRRERIRPFSAVKRLSSSTCLWSIAFVFSAQNWQTRAGRGESRSPAPPLASFVARGTRLAFVLVAQRQISFSGTVSQRPLPSSGHPKGCRTPKRRRLVVFRSVFPGHHRRVLWVAQDDHLAGDDFDRLVLAAFTVVPTARLEPPFAIHPLALAQVLLADLGPAAPGD